jgi:hypothetical protein
LERSRRIASPLDGQAILPHHESTSPKDTVPTTRSFGAPFQWFSRGLAVVTKTSCRQTSSKFWKATWVVVAGCSLAATGCGLGDYEDSLNKEQVRLTRLEEDQAKLTAELTLPKEEEQPYDPSKPMPPRFPTPFFYRPPIGIASDQPAITVPGMIYSYPVARNAPFPPNSIQRLDVAASDTLARDAFVNEVCPRFGLLQFNVWEPKVILCPDRGERTFQRVIYPVGAGGTGVNYLYLYEDAGTHAEVIVIYESNLQLPKDVVDVIEYSLRTLAVGPEAGMLASQSKMTPHR